MLVELSIQLGQSLRCANVRPAARVVFAGYPMSGGCGA